MILTINGIEYKNIIVNSLDRRRVKKSGNNNGIFISGEIFNDVRHTYDQYSLTISPSLRHKEEYEELYTLLSFPQEEYEVKLPDGQDYIIFKAYVSSVSDKLRKMLPTGNIWEGFSVTFEGREPHNYETDDQ